MSAAAVVFWASAGALLYTHLGYPLVLLVLSRFRRLPELRGDLTPTVTFIIPAHNEAAAITGKISNLRSLDYPHDRLEIIVVSDASTDDTASLARAAGADVIELPHRSGKSAALNAGIAAASGDVIAFNDVAAVLRPDALTAAVSRLADPRVGCVSSEDVVVSEGGVGVGEGLYSRMDTLVRRLESRVVSATGMSGSFYVVRRHLCPPFPPEAATDMVSALHCVRQGCRAVVESASQVCIAAQPDAGREFARKVRTMVTGLHALKPFTGLLNPLRSGLFAWCLFSHKVMRYLLPVFAALMLCSTALLAERSRLFAWALGAQAAVAGITMFKLNAKTASLPRIFAVPAFVGVAVAAAASAWYRVLRGDSFAVWQPTQRSNPMPGSSVGRTPRTVVFLRSNAVSPDPRVEKEARAVHASGWLVMIVGWDRDGVSPLREDRDYATVVRLRLAARFTSLVSKLWHMARWQAVLLRWLVRNRKRYSLIHACDLDTIMPALLVARLFRKKLVYDMFDLYADMLRDVPSWFRAAARWAELWAVGKADATIIVDDCRREQIAGSRPGKLEVIYNTPEPVGPPATSGLKPSTPQPFRLAYIGLLHLDRGLLEVLHVMARHPEWRLDLGGAGTDEDRIREAASRLPHVVLHGQMPYEQALALYAQADLLFATYDPAIPNHRYSSANKLFEAMMLGKPIVVAEHTGMDRTVRAHGLGAVVRYGDIPALESAISGIAAMPESDRRQLAVRARQVYEDDYHWHHMRERLVSLYDSLSPESAARFAHSAPGV